MTAVCKICKETVTSLLVGMDREKLEEDMAIVLLEHMSKNHQSYMRGLVELSRIFSGFIVMNRFAIADEGMEDEKENMRDKLAERVMQDAPDEFDNEDDDNDEDSLDEEQSKNNEQEEKQSRETIESVEEARRRGEPQEVRRRKQKTESTQETKSQIEEVEKESHISTS